jgi:hypothetical protein
MSSNGNKRTACSSASLSHLAEYEELEKAGEQRDFVRYEELVI